MAKKPDYSIPFAKSYLVGLENNTGAFKNPDAGLDFQLDPGAPLFALASGTLYAANDPSDKGFGPDYPVIQLDTPIDGYYYIYYGHSDTKGLNGAAATNGKPLGHVNAGALIGYTSTTGHNAPPGWVEIGFGANTSGQPAATAAGHSDFGHQWNPYAQAFKDLLLSVEKTGKIPPGATTGGAGGGSANPGAPGGAGSNAPNAAGGSGGGGGGGGDNVDSDYATHSWAKAAAFATFISLPDALNTQTSMMLTGSKSLMNDKPLLPFLEQLSQACLRNFQSLPNGNFFAFFPDYFGGFGQRTPYWQIEDIEIIDGKIDLSDDALATHVFVVGDNTGPFDGVDLFDMINSAGVVTVTNAFSTGFLGVPDPFADAQVPQRPAPDGTPQPPNTKASALAFLRRYGARPYYEEAPMVRSPYYEGFLAFQRFCLLWSRQFVTTFKLTFMPELFPGGLIQMPQHGLQCYVDEVHHSCSYETGFTTEVNLSAPAALLSSATTPLDPTKAWVHEGMIRAQVFNTEYDKPGVVDNSQTQQAKQQNAQYVKDKITGAGQRG